MSFRRSAISSDSSCSSQRFSCATEFGLSRPLMAWASSRSCPLLTAAISRAASTSSRSTATPRRLICWSSTHWRCTSSGTGNPESLCSISISATTSWRLYSMKSRHFSGSWWGRFRVRLPLVLVGLHGLQKYWMRALPTAFFCLSSGSPMALSTRPSPAGRPQYCPCSWVHLHCAAQAAVCSSVSRKCRDRQYHSKAAL